MKPLSASPKLLLVAIAVLALQPFASAQIIVDYHGGATFGIDAYASQISSSDLVEAGSPDLSYVLSSPVANGSIAALNDGVEATSPSEDATYHVLDFSTFATSTGTIVFGLNIDANPNGYDITSINSFAGYNQEQGAQNFELYVQSVSDSSWVDLGNYANNVGFGGTANQGESSLTTITDSSGVIASGVGAVELVYGADFNVLNSDTNVQEIDIQGTPTLTEVVPEPSTWAMLIGGVGILFFWQRRKTALL